MKRSSKIILIIMIPLIYGLPILLVINSVVNYDTKKELLLKNQAIDYFCEEYNIGKKELHVIDYYYFNGKFFNVKVSSERGKVNLKYNGKEYKLVYESGEWNIKE